MPTCIILAQDLPKPNSTVERMVAMRWDHQQCQALAAVGGGQQPGFTLLVIQPESATPADGLHETSANIYGSTAALTWVVVGCTKLPARPLRACLTIPGSQPAGHRLSGPDESWQFLPHLRTLLRPAPDSGPAGDSSWSVPRRSPRCASAAARA